MKTIQHVHKYIYTQSYVNKAVTVPTRPPTVTVVVSVLGGSAPTDALHTMPVSAEYVAALHAELWIVTAAPENKMVLGPKLKPLTVILAPPEVGVLSRQS